MSAQLSLVAIVAAHERAMLVSAAEQLSQAVAHVTGAAWPIRLRFVAADAPPERGAVTFVSLTVDLALGWDTPARAAFWQARSGRTFLATPYRHVPDRRAHPEAIERIRRLALFAIRLSREADVMLVDLDRAFALVGARALAAGGAGRIGGRAIAAAILRDGLDDRLAPDIQQRAIDHLEGR